MRKLTKVGIAGLLTLGLAGGTTAAFASADTNQAKPDVKKEQTVVEHRHDSAKDLKVDRSGKDTYKETWDRSGKDGGAKDGTSKDGGSNSGTSNDGQSKDGQSKDGQSNDNPTFDRTAA